MNRKSRDRRSRDSRSRQSTAALRRNLAAETADLEGLPDFTGVDPHPYLPFLHKVEKPGRYVGGEPGSIRKQDCHTRIALAFPDAYEIGMSHLGYRILYDHLNGLDGVAAERVYAPWPDLEQELRQRQLPLVSLESWAALSSFDCVGFSLQYELTFTNVLTMLDLGGIPLRSELRADQDPLVIAGGPVAFQPEPMAPFFDCFLVGDGEGFFAAAVALWVQLRSQGVRRRQRLCELSKLDGIYVPSLYGTTLDSASGLEVVTEPQEAGVPHQVRRAHVKQLDDHPWPQRSPVANTEIVFDRTAVEIARGCTEGCRFCQAGMVYRPVRERHPTRVVDAVQGSLRCGGFDEAGLTSLSTADYSAIEPLVERILAELPDGKTTMTVSSLRAYGLSEKLLDVLSAGRNTSLTFAPEAGTQRLRDVINKNVTDEHIQTSAQRIFERGWRRMKCYFMIGLPTETDEDVLGIVATGKRLMEVARGYPQRKRTRITVSVSNHVPKPFTPFQWAAMDCSSEILRKQQLLAESCHGRGLTLRMHPPDSSRLEGILARGDRRLANVIETAWRRGSRFDSWEDHLSIDVWNEALEEQGLTARAYLDELPVDGRLPWDHLSCGVDQEFLRKEYRRALSQRSSPPCSKPFPMLAHPATVEDAEEDQRPMVCHQCGLECDLDHLREGRIDSLRSLEAHRPEKLEDSEPEVTGDEAVSLRPGGPTRPPRRAFANQIKHAYRFRYAKFGLARFLSQLDMARLIPRAFRRAGLELGYSEGFHPQPLFSYGPPLRLGLAGIGELLEMKLVADLAPDEIIERVNRELPGGVLLRGGHKVAPEAPRFSKQCAWADYLVFLPEADARRIGVEDLEMLRSATELCIERVRRTGETRSVNIASGIDAVDFLEELPFDARDLLTLDRYDRLLQLRLGLQGDDMVRPEEVLGQLFGDSPCRNPRVIRRRLLPAPVRRSGRRSESD